jgi:hypothetical protein
MRRGGIVLAVGLAAFAFWVALVAQMVLGFRWAGAMADGRSPYTFGHFVRGCVLLSWPTALGFTLLMTAVMWLDGDTTIKGVVELAVQCLTLSVLSNFAMMGFFLLARRFREQDSGSKGA